MECGYLEDGTPFGQWDEVPESVVEYVLRVTPRKEGIKAWQEAHDPNQREPGGDGRD